MRQKKNIPAYVGHLLGTEIDSIDFKNKNLTTKTRQKSHIYIFKYSMIIEVNEHKSSYVISIAVK